MESAMAEMLRREDEERVRVDLKKLLNEFYLKAMEANREVAKLYAQHLADFDQLLKNAKNLMNR